MIRSNLVRNLFLFILLCYLPECYADEMQNASMAFFLTYYRIKNAIIGIGDAVSSYGIVLLYFFLLVDLIFALMSDWRLATISTTIMRTVLLAGFYTFLLTGVSSILSSGASDASKMASNVSSGSVQSNPSAIFDYGLAQAEIMFIEASAPSDAVKVLEDVEKEAAARYPNLIKFVNFIGSHTPLTMMYSSGKSLLNFMDNPVKRFLCGISGFFILCVFTVISVNILLTYLAFIFMCYAGVFLLGFGGSKITREIAIAYLRSLFAQAIIYYSMAMLASFCQNLFNNIAMKVLSSSDHSTLPCLGALCVVAYGSYKLITQLPMLMGSIAGGRPLNGLSPTGIFSCLLNATIIIGTAIVTGGAGAVGMAAAKGAGKAAGNAANQGKLD